MSTITVVQDAIVGTPEAARLMIDSVVGFMAEATGYSYSEDFKTDITKLKEEIIRLHTYGDEGFFIFNTELIDAVLNRVYPYLVSHSLDNDLTISLERTEELTEDLTQIVNYDIESKKSETPDIDPTEGEEADIDANPFPRPPGIESPLIPNPLGTPLDGEYPMFDGRPYNPLDPTARDLQPLVPRTPEQAVEAGYETPERQEPSNIIGDITDYEDNTDDPSGDFTDNIEEPDQEDEETGKASEAELEEKSSGILQKILEAIIDQGQKTRQSIADTTYAIDLELIKIEESIDELLPGFTEAIDKGLDAATGASDWLEEETRSFIEGLFKNAIDLSDSLEEGTREVIDAIFDKVVEVSENPGDAIDSALDTAGELITDALGLGYALIAGAIDDSTAMIKWLGEQYIEAASNTLGFMTDAFSMSEEDLTDWICRFFSMITDIKNKCSVFNEGRL